MRRLDETSTKHKQSQADRITALTTEIAEADAELQRKTAEVEAHGTSTLAEKASELKNIEAQEHELAAQLQ